MLYPQQTFAEDLEKLVCIPTIAMWCLRLKVAATIPVKNVKRMVL